ncbi:MAG: MarR family winged helix-turn-helix transcriptional regulator [Thermomicrobiales bacterium]
MSERTASTLVTPPADARTAVHPKWLTVDFCHDEEPEEAFDGTRFGSFMQLLKVAGALDRAATHALADLDLTAGAFAALLELESAAGIGLAPSELARRLAVARRTATLYVDILSRHGWVERTAHPDDRRMVLARLTDAGLELLEDQARVYKQRLAALLNDMSPLQAERMRQLLSLIDTTGKPPVALAEASPDLSLDAPVVEDGAW